MGFEWLLICRNSSNPILYFTTPTQFLILKHLQKVTCHVVTESFLFAFESINVGLM